MSDPTKTPGGGQPSTETPHLRPGDEAPPGTPGSGETTCRDCNGTGTVNGRPCPTCEGTGKVNVEIGGA